MLHVLLILFTLFTTQLYAVLSFEAVQGATELRSKFQIKHHDSAAAPIIVVIDGFFDLNHPKLKGVFETSDYAPLSQYVAKKMKKNPEKWKKLKGKNITKALKKLHADESLPEATRSQLPELFSAESGRLKKLYHSFVVTMLSGSFDHGTHVSGVIASQNYGMAPGVKILPVEGAFTNITANLPNIIEAYKDRIIGINISLATLTDMWNNLAVANKQIIQTGTYSEHIEILADVAERYGIPTFLAAGNKGKAFCKKQQKLIHATLNEYFEENNPMISLVSAIDIFTSIDLSSGCVKFSEEERLAAISNFPEALMHKYFISAPGVNIKSTTWNGETKLMTGTSFASPIAMGAYALLREYILQQEPPQYDLNDFDDRRQLTLDTLSILRESARRNTTRGTEIGKESTGRGIIDLEKAAELVLTQTIVNEF
jgi:subtilisin family serine protease